MNSILVISVNWLGDVVFSTPVYHALKGQYPRARIVAMGVPRVADVLALCPDIDEVMVYDEDGYDRPLVRKGSIIREIKKRKFDSAFILRRSFSRTLLTALAGVPVRVGFGGPGWHGLLTTSVDPKGMEDLHRSDGYLRVVESADVPVRDRVCRLKVGEDDIRIARHWLSTRGVGGKERLIALNTGGNWAPKQWPLERFADLARAIEQKGLGRVVLPGAPKDLDRVTRISELSGGSPVIAAGETSLRDLAGIMSQMDVVVSADSGPLHLANALGTDVIGLFGPTSPEITGPRGAGKSVVIQKDVGCNRAPCYFFECKESRCMAAIEVKDVLEAVAQLEH